jgi:AcrR family transcriptional regulator
MDVQRHRVLGRDDILAEAANQFAEWRYHGTDMGRLADALQMSKGSLNRYFHSKEDLFLAAVDLSLRRLSDAAQATAGCRVPSAMPTSAASEGPPPR